MNLYTQGQQAALTKLALSGDTIKRVLTQARASRGLLPDKGIAGAAEQYAGAGQGIKGLVQNPAAVKSQARERLLGLSNQIRKDEARALTQNRPDQGMQRLRSFVQSTAKRQATPNELYDQAVGLPGLQKTIGVKDQARKDLFDPVKPPMGIQGVGEGSIAERIRAAKQGLV